MTQFKTRLKWALLPATFFLAQAVLGQAVPTATRALQLTGFGAATGVFTDLKGGHNLGITAGANLSILSFAGFHPAIELRGTYPFHPGTIVGQKSALGGVRIDHQYGRLRPYANFLIGRGQLTYENGGITVGFLNYISTTSTVYSPGAGLEVDLSPHWALKTDYQYQSWKTPVVASGTIHPSVFSVGATYKFSFNQTYKKVRDTPPAGGRR